MGRLVSRSRDRGATWSAPEPMLPEVSTCEGSLIRHGDKLLFAGPRGHPDGSRRV